jgi:folylpolyglutamate synthase/dihydropteroate synthase
LKKGGIFKRGIDALVGPNCPMDELKTVADKNGAMLYTLESVQAEFIKSDDSVQYLISQYMSPASSTSSESENENVESLAISRASVSVEVKDTNLKFSGIEPDVINANLCIAGFHLLKKQGGLFASVNLFSNEVLAGIQSRPPCRWEQHEMKGVQVVLDVGHNPAAVDSLMKKVQRDLITGKKKNVRVLYAMSRDKDVRTCLRSILTVVPGNCIHFAQSNNWRAMTGAQLNDIYKEETGADMYNLGQDLSLKETIDKVIHVASEEEHAPGAVVICGTAYIMPEARAVLGVVEPRDSTDLKRGL